MKIQIKIEQAANGYVIECEGPKNKFKLVCFKLAEVEKLVSGFLEDHLTKTDFEIKADSAQPPEKP